MDRKLHFSSIFSLSDSVFASFKKKVPRSREIFIFNQLNVIEGTEDIDNVIHRYFLTASRNSTMGLERGLGV